MARTGWLMLVLLGGCSGSASPEATSPGSNDLAPYEDPNDAARGLWSECVLNLSFACIQRRTLSFIDRLGRADRVPLVGDTLSLVRTSETQPLPRAVDEIDDTETLGRLVDQAVDSYFDSHVVRFTTPWFLSRDGRSSDTIDLDVTRVDDFEGRKGQGGGGGHGGGGGGKRGMKKMMMMMCMMMVGKMMMMGPLMLGLTKIIALKALLFGSISLLISKIMILKKLKMGGGLGGGGGGGGWSGGGGGGYSSGGGGGGWSSGGGGGGGWDRAAHNVAYSAYAPTD